MASSLVGVEASIIPARSRGQMLTFATVGFALMFSPAAAASRAPRRGGERIG